MFPQTFPQTDRSVSAESLAGLLTEVQSLYPDLDTSRLLGGYSGLRPASQHQDYCISFDLGRGWVTVASIRSTGLTCSLAISQYVARTILQAGHVSQSVSQSVSRLTE